MSSPSSGLSKPKIISIKVVLPEPVFPTIPIFDPEGIVKLIPFNTFKDDLL